MAKSDAAAKAASKAAASHSSHSSHSSSSPSSSPKAKGSGSTTVVVSVVVLLLSAAIAFFLLGEPLAPLTVTDPIPLPQVKSLSQFKETKDKYYWGSYRPHVYFGLRTRAPQSILTGMMWYGSSDGRMQLRHICEQGDRIRKYGWTHHDGASFGAQTIHDGKMLFETSFVRQEGGTHGGDWVSRISLDNSAENTTPAPSDVYGMFYYVANEGPEPLAFTQDGTVLTGKTPGLGAFRLHFRVGETKQKMSYAGLYVPQLEKLKDYVLQLQAQNAFPWGQVVPNANVYLLFVVVKTPFVLDVVFESQSARAGEEPSALRVQHLMDTARVSALITNRKAAFEKRFEATFNLASKGVPEGQVVFARNVFSNLVGGIGYWHGHSLVKDVAAHAEYNSKPKGPNSKPPKPLQYFDAPLYSAVPSRSFFPRGFMWDEGFHQVLIYKWDPAITRGVLAHWLDLMNAYGWIPREQILGAEARDRVPREFVEQPPDNANPPTWFLVVEDMLDRMDEAQASGARADAGDLEFLQGAYPRLSAWFRWFDTQRGNLTSTYRWRGRERKQGFLNALTLTSGLDDYPRASHPDEREYHVDLRCWMGEAASVLARMADKIGHASVEYSSMAASLKNNTLLNSLHWSQQHRGYFDFGKHALAKNQKPKRQFVHDTYGYVSLFPFLLRFLEPNSTQLGVLLEDLDNRNLLWTDYGLRSLAASSPYYQVYNTEHDPPYWRGAIWINMNFLAVRALHHYATLEGPYKHRAQELYTRLRQNLITNIFQQYETTGYIWEQYNDKTGEGKGSHPFTGWSSLIVAILGESY